MEVRQTTLREANAYVEQHHRHHDRVIGHKWSLAAYKDGQLCGVAIVGRPTGRRLDDGKTLEVTRLCTDGTRNACSFLYAAATRRAFLHRTRRPCGKRLASSKIWRERSRKQSVT